MAPGINGHSNKSIEQILFEAKQTYDRNVLMFVLQIGIDVLIRPPFELSPHEAELWANLTAQACATTE